MARTRLRPDRHGCSLRRDSSLLRVACLLGGLAAALPNARADDSRAGLALGDVPRAPSAVVVDGRLDDAAWAGALVLDLAVETDATVNEPAALRTECRLLYDDRHLYVSFRAEDPDPSRLRAQVADRDSDPVFNGDTVGVILDPFHDGRIGYAFLVNPLGVQLDLVVNDITGDQDVTWDAIWKSAGRPTPGGYEVEFAIPFSALRFPRSEAAQTWGLDAFRIYPRDKFYRFAVNPLSRDVSCVVCQFGSIGGLQGIRPGRSLVVTPTLVLSRTDAVDDAGEMADGEILVDPGLTVRWGVTPNLTLGATANPDFSQIEADAVQLDVNEQFALYYEERRPFFLEGADYFQTPLAAVYTRSVADPEAGLKLVGKIGGASLGVLAVQDAVTNVTLPGRDYSDTLTLDQRSWGGAARWRQDISAASAVGALVTTRATVDGYVNAVAGLDGLVRLSDSDQVKVQALGSASQNNDALIAAGEPATNQISHAVHAAYEHTSTHWNAGVAYEDVGEAFRADVGYVPQVDHRGGEARLTRYWLGDAEDWYSRLHASARVEGRLDQGGAFLDAKGRLQGGLEGIGQTYAVVGAEARRRTYAGETFDQLGGDLYVESYPTGALSLSLYGAFGHEIDYVGARPGIGAYVAPSVGVFLGRHLEIGVSASAEHLALDEGPLYTATATQLRAVYQFDVRTFVRVVSQYVQTDYQPELYPIDVPAREDFLYDQLLFSFKLNPQTVAFLGYSDAWDLSTGDQLNRTFFVKVGYAWQP